MSERSEHSESSQPGSRAFHDSYPRARRPQSWEHQESLSGFPHESSEVEEWTDDIDFDTNYPCHVVTQKNHVSMTW